MKKYVKKMFDMRSPLGIMKVSKANLVKTGGAKLQGLSRWISVRQPVAAILGEGGIFNAKLNVVKTEQQMNVGY